MLEDIQQQLKEELKELEGALKGKEDRLVIITKKAKEEILEIKNKLKVVEKHLSVVEKANDNK